MGDLGVEGEDILRCNFQMGAMPFFFAVGVLGQLLSLLLF